MPESSTDPTIEREKVERLAQNIRTSVDEVTKLLDADDIEIERLLEVTRFIARSARRISRRANWTIGAPQPGNERDPKRSSGGERRTDRPQRGGRGNDDRGPRSGSDRVADRRPRDNDAPRPRRSAAPGPRSGGGSSGRSGDRGRGNYRD